MHACPRAPLCDECVLRQTKQLAGAMQVWGENWALDVAARMGNRPWRPWPAYEADERMCRRAIEIVEPMTSGGDERLREVFARACVEGAIREWEHLHADALYKERRLGNHARNRRGRL